MFLLDVTGNKIILNLLLYGNVKINSPLNMLFATLETRRKWTELTSNDKDQQAKICQYSEKKHLKISKDAKFDCDLVKSNEYIATQSN